MADEKKTRDHRQEVTDLIIEMLEGDTEQWRKPWTTLGFKTPYNTTSLTPYRGGNALYLMAEGIRRGYNDPRWLTFNQAKAKGWQVRKGEKGTHIEYWEYPGSKKSAPDGLEETEEGKRPYVVHRVWTVFNASQIDGIPPYEDKPRQEWEIVEAGERILSNSGAAIHHDQADRAFYSPASDTIHTPPKEAFGSATGYYGTALHELGHWTGHASRLNRLTLDNNYRFGSPDYAREELRAELASLFLAAERGIPYDLKASAAYAKSWIRPLQQDKNEIFRAASDAQKIADYVLAFDQAQAPEPSEPPPAIQPDDASAAGAESPIPAPAPTTTAPGGDVFEAGDYHPDASRFDLDLARRGYAGMSWTPEKRAEQDRQSFIDHARDLYQAVAPLAVTDAQKAILRDQMARYEAGYLEKYHAMVAAKARTVSPMITGPANFPVRRNQKRMATEDRRRDEFLAWQPKAEAAIRKAVLAGRTADQVSDDGWQTLKRVIDKDMAMVRAIDACASFFTRAAFVDSTVGRIRRIAEGGDTTTAATALDYIRERQEGWQKPFIAARNGIWNIVQEVEARQAAHPPKSGEEEIYSGDGVRAVRNHDLDRLQLFFDGSPPFATREALKSNGWHWSCQQGAWQRQITPNAEYALARLIEGQSLPKEEMKGQTRW